MARLNEALRYLRLFHNISQSNLAGDLKISNSYLSELESGKKSIHVELLEKYSKVFNIPISSIILFSEKIESDTLSEKTRLFVSGKVLKIMDWLVAKDCGNDKSNH